MTDPSDYLYAVRQRVEAATEGPWERYSVDFREHRSHSVKAPGSGGLVVSFEGYGPDGGTAHENATFIAHARTDVPRLVAAVEAVLGWHYIDSGMDGERICSHDGRNWPCPTIRAMQTALGGTS